MADSIQLNRDVLADVATTLAQEQGIALLIAEGRGSTFSASGDVSAKNPNLVHTEIEDKDRKVVATIDTLRESQGHVDLITSTMKEGDKVVLQIKANNSDAPMFTVSQTFDADGKELNFSSALSPSDKGNADSFQINNIYNKKLTPLTGELSPGSAGVSINVFLKGPVDVTSLTGSAPAAGQPTSFDISCLGSHTIFLPMSKYHYTDTIESHGLDCRKK